MGKKLLFAAILCASLLSLILALRGGTTVGTFEIDGATASVVWRVRPKHSWDVFSHSVFRDGLFRLEVRGKFYFIDKDGNMAIEPEHDEHRFGRPFPVMQFSDGLVAVELNGKFGFIDTQGNVAIPFEYSIASDFSEGLCFVVKDNKKGFIDKAGDMVIIDSSIKSMHYSLFSLYEIPEFSEGLASIQLEENDKWCFIDKTGEIVMSFESNEYDYVGNFSEGLANVYKTGIGMGYIDKTGELVIPMEYQTAHAFSEGLAQVSKSSHPASSYYGFIDKNGEIVIPLIYSRAWPFSGGLAYVKGGGNPPLSSDDGFIDKTGKIIIPLDSYGRYSFSGRLAFGSTTFSEGLALMSKRTIFGYRYGILEIVQ